MPTPVLSPLDFNKTELLNARAQNLGADPAGLGAGDKGLLWIDGNGQLKYWDGTQIKTLGLATGGNAETLNGEGPAFYLNRGNHTGNIPAANVSGLGSLATKSQIATGDVPDDAITFAKVQDVPTATILGRNAAGAGDIAALTPAQIRTLINVEDGATGDQTKNEIDALGINAATLGGATLAQIRDRSTHTGNVPAANVTGFDEAVDDRVNALVVTTGALTKTYDDAANKLTLGVNIDGGNAATVGGLAPSALEQVSRKNQPNGYAGLGADGKIAAGQIPALGLTDVNVVANIAARDALTVEEGDVAIVTGTSQSFIYDGANWVELQSPADGILTLVAGTGIASTGGANPTISIAAGGVGTTQLADTSVTAAKLANNAVDLASAKVTGTLPLAKGGTGATTAAAARTALGATTKVAANVGDGTATQITVTHNLNSYDVSVEVFRNSGSRETVIVDVERPTLNTVLLRFATAPAANAFRCVVTG